MNDISTELIGDAPGVYGRFHDNSAYTTEAARSIGAFVVESSKGRRGYYKVNDPEAFVQEYGHNPLKSVTTYGPLLYLQESNRAVVVRGLSEALQAGAIAMVCPAEADTPDGMAGMTLFRPLIVGEINDNKDVRLSDDHFLLFYDLSPGTSAKSIRLRPEVSDPEGGFWVEVFEGSNSEASERFQVSLTYRNDGYGNQMFIEQRLNKSSNLVRAVVNTSTQFALSDDLIDTDMRVWLNGGDAGKKLEAADVVSSLTLLADPERIRFNTLGLIGWMNPSVQNAAMVLCKRRKDAFAVCDVPRNMQSVADAKMYRNEMLRADSSYGALYAKHVIITDRLTNMDVAVPLGACAAASMAYTDREYRPSFAPAGRRRGDLQRFNVVGVDGDPYSLPERGELGKVQINVMKTLDEIGSFIWNDATLQKRQSMLSFIGVARLRNSLYTAITDTLDMYVFDPNDSTQRDTIDANARDILEVEKRGRSIKWYQTSFSSTLNDVRASDAGKLFYQVLYVPYASNRQIIVDYTIGNSGVTDISMSVQ